MILSELSVKRPVFATVLSLLIVIFGALAFSRLPLREYPDIDPPIVSVETAYVGASSGVIETRITQIIEDAVSGLEGIRTISSQSQDGKSTVTIEFSLKRDIDAAANDVRDAVSRVLKNLPDRIDPPVVSKQDVNASPIIWIALQSDTRNALQLTDYADRYLVDRFSILDGVARVRIGGERRYAMRIWLGREQMAARGLAVADIEGALNRENVELPAGRIESLQREFTVRVDRAYNTAEDFGKLVLKRGENGYLVRLSDVAKVETGPEDERTELRSAGRNTVGLGVSKQSKANTLGVARAVRAEVAQISKTLPPDIQISVAYDSSIFIDSSIHEVYVTLGIAALLVIVVIWAFLGDLRATLIPAVAVPISLTGTFIVLYALGFSLNLLTLLALVLAIGLVVDDAIVVLENVYKRIEAGQPPLAGAFMGSNQVAFAVVASTLTLVCVFIPMTFMQGNIGRLFTEFAWAIAGAVMFSGFVALTLTPMMCSKLLKQTPQGHRRNPVTRAVNFALDKFNAVYGRLLLLCFRFSWILAALMVLMGAAAFVLYKHIPSEYAPREDRGYFFTVMSAPEGASLEYSKRHMKKVEDILMDLMKRGEAQRVMSIVPQGFSSTGAVNGGFAIALLKNWDRRERHVKDIVGEMFGRFMGIPGVLAFPIMPPSLGQNPVSMPVQFVIGGTNYEDLARWRDLILEKARLNPHLINLDADYKETKPQIRVKLDIDRAADMGVSAAQVGKTLQTMFGSNRLTTYVDRGKEYKVILQAGDRDRLIPSDIGNLYIRSERSGELIPLSNIVHVSESVGAGTLNRFNRLRAITISASLAPGYTLGEALGFLENAAHETLPPEARIDYKGESREFREAGTTIYYTFLLAILTVFLILAAQFESFVHPLVIMTCVPFAIVGALIGLALTGATLNVYTEIGIVMLVGLAAKNGILIVEFANQLRDRGMAFEQAIIEASQSRLRPILMTAICTAIGAVPLIMATGAGAESRFPIGVVTFSGVLLATVLTLFIVPTFYALIGRKTKSPKYVSRLLEKELGETP